MVNLPLLNNDLILLTFQHSKHKATTTTMARKQIATYAAKNKGSYVREGLTDIALHYDRLARIWKCRALSFADRPTQNENYNRSNEYQARAEACRVSASAV